MKLITGYNCLLASAAMVLDVHPDVLTELIGHNGTEIIFPELPEAINKRGFHTQEIIDCAIEYGYAVTEIQAVPYLTPNSEDEYLVEFNVSHENRFQNHINGHVGIITGEINGKINERGHAVAWNGEMCFDCRGSICTLEDCDMDISSFYRFDKIIPPPDLETVKRSLQDAREGKGSTIDKILESI